MNRVQARRLRKERLRRLTYSSQDDPVFKKLVIKAVENLTGRPRLERLYNELHRMDIQGEEIWGAILEKLKINLHYDEQQLTKIPKEGPLVVVANHPFGVLDGLILGYIVSRARPRFFVLVNEVLTREPLLAPFLLPIDFRETKEAMRINIRSKQETLRRLKEGEALAIFPAGGVATATRLMGEAQDLEWKRFVAKVIQGTRSTVVPILFHGQNSRLFQVASHINMNLRLGLLLNEVRNKIGHDIHLSIGDPIPYEALDKLDGRQELLDFLRTETMALDKDQGPAKKRRRRKLLKRIRQTRLKHH